MTGSGLSSSTIGKRGDRRPHKKDYATTRHTSTTAAGMRKRIQRLYTFIQYLDSPHESPTQRSNGEVDASNFRHLQASSAFWGIMLETMRFLACLALVTYMASALCASTMQQVMYAAQCMYLHQSQPHLRPGNTSSFGCHERISYRMALATQISDGT